MATKCKIINCEREVYAKDLCNTHYLRNWVKNHPESIFKSRWVGILVRCNNAQSKSYKNYGGRGIGICNEWLIYKNFKRDMHSSFRPELSLDRIDNNKGYSKENCRWTTGWVQHNNTRKNHYITRRGITKTFSEWCRILGLKHSTISQRFHCYGWTLDRSFNNFTQGGQIAN